MNIFRIILIFIIACSCNNAPLQEKRVCNNLTGINQVLYDVILAYQTEIPIPQVSKIQSLPPSPESSFRYIYEVNFFRGVDTGISIQLKIDGITQKDSIANIYGIYQDSCLRPTYFILDSNLPSPLLKTFKKEKLNDFYYDKSSRIDIFYDKYNYKINGKSIVLVNKIKGNNGR